MVMVWWMVSQAVVVMTATTMVIHIKLILHDGAIHASRGSSACFTAVMAGPRLPEQSMYVH